MSGVSASWLCCTTVWRTPIAEAAAYFYRALIHEQRGAWAQALTDCEEARRIGERMGDLFRMYLAKTTQGRVYTLSGDPARGRVLLEEGAALAEQLGTNFWLAWRTCYLAACLLTFGELEAVPPLCYEAIRLQQAIGAKPELSRSYVSYTRMLQAQGEGEKARTYLSQAIDMFRQMGMTWDLVRAEQALHSIP